MLCHVDADSFFASVLVRTHPHLRGKPLLALGMGGGCVIAASYEAKAFGVRTGMRLHDALRLVPTAVSLPSDFRETALASAQIESILRALCPAIERASVDEWYLDLSGIISGTTAHFVHFGESLRLRILRSTCLSVSVGIASSKILAKMAGEYRKPAGVTVLASDEREREIFLRDRPIAAIPGIGSRRSLHASVQGWHTAWDFSTANTQVVSSLFGKTGITLQRELQGEQLSPVVTQIPLPQSMSRCRSFRLTSDCSVLRAHALRHLDYLVMKMRSHKLACLSFSVRIRTADFRPLSITFKLPGYFNTEASIRPFLLRCLSQLFAQSSSCTQIGLTLQHFTSFSFQQTSLFDGCEDLRKAEQLQSALDNLHHRFGRQSISSASALQVSSGTDIGFDLPYC